VSMTGCVSRQISVNLVGVEPKEDNMQVAETCLLIGPRLRPCGSFRYHIA
jgi:hypothetical protein